MSIRQQSPHQKGTWFWRFSVAGALLIDGWIPLVFSALCNFSDLLILVCRCRGRSVWARRKLCRLLILRVAVHALTPTQCLQSAATSLISSGLCLNFSFCFLTWTDGPQFIAIPHNRVRFVIGADHQIICIRRFSGELVGIRNNKFSGLDETSSSDWRCFSSCSRIAENRGLID